MIGEVVIQLCHQLCPQSTICGTAGEGEGGGVTFQQQLLKRKINESVRLVIGARFSYSCFSRLL